MSILLNRPAVIDPDRPETPEPTATEINRMARAARPRKKQPRFVQLALPLNADGKNGVLRITEGKKVDEYLLDRIPSDFGDGFRVEKRDYGGDDTTHNVNLSDAGHLCDCKGYLRWGHCRHVESLTALRTAGKL